ncbi:MAG: adenylate/guanylate cyclase domain-containing protein, partial [Actinomycetota bacterium]|nr:adenylate/guanylate cyclase domain-containing protein [Actinomycetota bacterium]
MSASADLPTGTVTFLLTDVEGSTRMFERSADGTLWALQRHHELLADAIERHGGVLAVEQGEGDSVVAVFPRAADAVVCAAEAQRALGAQEWPDGLDMRVRVGVHTGEGILRAAGRYSGLALHRCARVRGVGHGGQVLVTATTAELAHDVLPKGLELIDLGEQRLRDLSRPERVFQLAGPGLTRSFPPLRSLDAVTTNLKVQLTNFVGREAEMHDVDVLLGASRLVTLTGSGGVGKTRLALHAVAERAGTADGVWLADLAGLSDPDAVASFVDAAIGGREEPGRIGFDLLVERLGVGNCILVLDNCEHIIAPVAQLAADLTTALPSLLIVATSREPLGVPGEVVYRVPSMALPAATALSDEAEETDAVRLFADRARLVRPPFVLTAEVCEAVVEICRRVDGLPL